MRNTPTGRSLKASATLNVEDFKEIQDEASVAIDADGFSDAPSDIDVKDSGDQRNANMKYDEHWLITRDSVKFGEDYGLSDDRDKTMSVDGADADLLDRRITESKVEDDSKIIINTNINDLTGSYLEYSRKVGEGDDAEPDSGAAARSLDLRLQDIWVPGQPMRLGSALGMLIRSGIEFVTTKDIDPTVSIQGPSPRYMEEAVSKPDETDEEFRKIKFGVVHSQLQLDAFLPTRPVAAEVAEQILGNVIDNTGIKDRNKAISGASEGRYATINNTFLTLGRRFLYADFMRWFSSKIQDFGVEGMRVNDLTGSFEFSDLIDVPAVILSNKPFNKYALPKPRTGGVSDLMAQKTLTNLTNPGGIGDRIGKAVKNKIESLVSRLTGITASDFNSTVIRGHITPDRSGQAFDFMRRLQGDSGREMDGTIKGSPSQIFNNMYEYVEALREHVQLSHMKGDTETERVESGLTQAKKDVEGTEAWAQTQTVIPMVSPTELIQDEAEQKGVGVTRLGAYGYGYNINEDRNPEDSKIEESTGTTHWRKFKKNMKPEVDEDFGPEGVPKDSGEWLQKGDDFYTYLIFSYRNQQQSLQMMNPELKIHSQDSDISSVKVDKRMFNYDSIFRQSDVTYKSKRDGGVFGNTFNSSDANLISAYSVDIDKVGQKKPKDDFYRMLKNNTDLYGESYSFNDPQIEPNGHTPDSRSLVDSTFASNSERKDLGMRDDPRYSHVKHPFTPGSKDSEEFKALPQAIALKAAADAEMIDDGVTRNSASSVYYSNIYWMRNRKYQTNEESLMTNNPNFPENYTGIGYVAVFRRASGSLKRTESRYYQIPLLFNAEVSGEDRTANWTAQTAFGRSNDFFIWSNTESRSAAFKTTVAILDGPDINARDNANLPTHNDIDNVRNAHYWWARGWDEDYVLEIINRYRALVLPRGITGSNLAPPIISIVGGYDQVTSHVSGGIEYTKWIVSSCSIDPNYEAGFTANKTPRMFDISLQLKEAFTDWSDYSTGYAYKKYLVSSMFRKPIANDFDRVRGDGNDEVKEGQKESSVRKVE